MAPRPKPAVKKEKRCVFCQEVKPANAFFRHSYKLRSGEESTRFMSGCKQCNNKNRQALRDSRYTPQQLQRNERQRKRRPIQNEYQRKYRKDDPRRWRGLHLLRTFGITLDQFEELSAKQGGRCAVCRLAPLAVGIKKARLHVDHCHTTNRVRGLLCHRCNVSIGLLGEDPARVRALADYLEAFLGAVGSSPAPSSQEGVAR